MSETEKQGYQTEGELDEILDVRHYTGGHYCQYQCGNLAAFVVVAQAGARRLTFVGCRSCLNKSRIYPIDNEWVDERTDQVQNA